MDNVKHYMEEPFISMDGNASILDTVKTMNENKIGSILVCEKGEPVGIFTEQDLLRRVVSADLNLASQSVSKVMSHPLITIESGQNILEAFYLMHKSRVRHLVVTEDGKVVGVISIKDVANYYVNKFGPKPNQSKSGK